MADETEALSEHVSATLRAIYVASRMPILVLRRSGEIVSANPAACAQYGFSLEEFQALRVHDLVQDGRDVDAEIAEFWSGEPVVATRRPHRTKDGRILSVLPSAFRLDPATPGREALLVSFLQDVTSLEVAEAREARAHEEARELEAKTKALRAELLAADRLVTIGRFVAGVAHEVNNPAALVALNLGILRERLKNGALRTDEALSIIDDSIDAMARIRDIVQDVKGFARERAKERVDLSRLAAGVMRLTQLDADVGANVATRFEPDVFARVRGSRLSQVLVNLLLNAAQASPASSREGEAEAAEERSPCIQLRTFRAGDEACIEVSDSGPGVPEHLTERIFEPFFTTRADAGGTGLGLWLARGIVEEEGGTLAFSARPGGGAVFRVSLPAAGP